MIGSRQHLAQELSRGVSNAEGSIVVKSLFPIRGERDIPDEPEPEIVELADEQAGDLFEVLSSKTAREILQLLNEEPRTTSELAEQIDTSVQNTHYHVENLLETGAIEVLETEYSAKGREMDVYTATGRPLVIVSDAESETSHIKDAIKGLLSGFALLAILSALVQLAAPKRPLGTEVGEAGGAVATPPPPGLLFFFGGAAVLLAGFAWWYVTRM